MDKHLLKNKTYNVGKIEDGVLCAEIIADNKDVIIRFAFGSDPSYSTAQNSDISGFQVDEIKISADLYNNYL